jgi:hypothetical protein
MFADAVETGNIGRHGEERPEVADPPHRGENRRGPIIMDSPFTVKSREQAARVTGASGKGVQMAKKVASVAPDLKEKVTFNKPG